MENVKKTTIKL